MARKMKNSGIEWIGEIPTDFSLYKLKYLLSSPLCYGANESGTLYSDILPRYIRITDISPNGTLKNSGMLSLDESSAQNYMLHEGDILFARSGATVGKSFIYHNYYGRAAYAGYLIKASFNRLVLPEFVYYYTCSSAYEIWKNSIFIQSTIQNIGADRYSNLPISVPNSIDKQLRIVRYLNNFCSKFDAIIYNLQTSIEDYKKLKQAIITQAITKGVRGEREMKDSGIAWIGEIPKEWDIIKSSRIIKTTQNGLSRRDLEKSEGQIILKLKNITSDGKIDYSFLNRITLSQNELNTYALTTGDFLFVRVNGSKSLVGKCAIFEAISEIVAYNDHIIRVKLSNQCYNRFFLWYLYSCCGKAEIDLHTSTAAGQYTISGDGLRDITLVFPPIDEQKEIADYLDAKCAEIDKLIAKKEQLVKELESYKKSLIYEVVTGKREV
ncbi:MAG TPA: restriction endonuclease subunit S [Faecalibacterium prausnitzii]|nr:restriction endonuclease subunit S [Faecalibacterium prausnitzii]